MRIDFHIHGKVCKKYKFNKENFDGIINEAIDTNLDAIGLTEHCYLEDYSDMYNYLKDNYIYQNDYYIVDKLKVFVGMEVTTNEGIDIVIVGNRDDVCVLREETENYAKKEGKPVGVCELINICKEKEVLIIIAHPYRHAEEFPEYSKEILKKVDAVELNATDMYKKGIEMMKLKVEGLSKKIELPIVYGSDSHHFIQIGSVYNEFDKNVETIKEFKEEIEKSNYHSVISPNLRIKAKSHTIIKGYISDNVFFEF
ncbi:MAG: histidinol-phosphatase [Oscillospiraceae bacterium]|nr:histidinol-phosphatase [Oscillospiraceae bacterium]